jgi:general secretion pathway protein D
MISRPKLWWRFPCVSLSVAIGASSVLGQGPVVTYQTPPQVDAKPKPVANARKKDTSLRTYNLPPEMVGTVGADLRIKYAGLSDVTITTEPGTDRLMVNAPESTHREITSTVARINSEVGLQIAPAGGEAAAPVETQRLYQLRNCEWEDFEKSLQTAGAKKLSEYKTTQGVIADYRIDGPNRSRGEMRIDRRNNSVLLQGSSKEVSAYQRVVAAIDNGHASDAPFTSIVPLDRAKPEKVQQAMTLVRTVAFQQDQATQDEEDATGVADANQLADDDQATAIGTSDGLNFDSGLFGDVQIEFVPESGLAIIKGNKRDVERAIQVIEQIKQISQETQPEIKVVMLKHVDSLALGTTLGNLFRDNFAARQGNVNITGLGQPNAILLIGREEAMVSVMELIEKLDQPLDPSSQLKVFKLIHQSAIDAQTLVRDFFVNRPGSDTTQRQLLGVRVSVVADYRTNSLIIQASPRDLQEVSRMIEELDVPSTQSEVEVRVFPLRNALADDLQPVLQSAINPPAATGGADQARPPSGKISIATRPEDGPGDRISGGILAGVTVTSNPSTNSLVVRAPAKSMDLIDVLIKQLDQPPSLESQIKVFAIENNDATALAQTIQQLLGLPVTAGVATGGIGAAFNQNAGTGAGNDILVPLRVSVDTRSNSIIVSGSREDLEVVEVVLWRLDEEGVQTRKTEVVWLRNSDAADVAQAINDFLTTQRQTIQQQLLQGQAISIFEQIDREVIVVAEPTTNSLIISATPRYYEDVMAVIERLDRRPPLIMVQLLMAEVTLSDTFELGTELGLQDSLIFDRNVATGGTLNSPGFNLTNAFNSSVTAGQPQRVAGQSLSGFGLNRTNSTLGYGGLVLSAASESVNILVRALQDANRLQILSRPQVMTLDTIEAFVQVGQRVPRVQSATSGNVNVAPTIVTEDTDVGLIMRIQPRTNQDGLILLDVQIERSTLGDEASGIPVGFGANGEVIRSPIINTTRAQTRVSAYDGQTVVFAGLIQKSRTSRSRRIPYLADIPIAGNLFKFDSETESRSELLVIMTPRIIHGENDLEMINQLETARMSWCLADVVNLNGVANLSSGNGLWGPTCSTVIYPDVTPSIEYVDGVPMEVIADEGAIEYRPTEVSEPALSVPAPLVEPSYLPTTPSVQPSVEPSLLPEVNGQPSAQLQPEMLRPLNTSIQPATYYNNQPTQFSR